MNGRGHQKAQTKDDADSPSLARSLTPYHETPAACYAGSIQNRRSDGLCVWVEIYANVPTQRAALVIKPRLESLHGEARSEPDGDEIGEGANERE